MYLKVNEKTFDLKEASSREEMMAGHRRNVLTLVINGSSYAELSETLVDGVTLTIVDNFGEYQHVEYSKAGSIKDNRDGTFECKMGYPNTTEQDLQDERDAANKIIVTIAGSQVDADSAEQIRGQIEAAAAYVPEAAALDMPSVFPTWDKLLAEGDPLEKGFILNLNGQLYITENYVLPIESQRPDDDGMLAVYRPINRQQAGTQEDPISWVYGMDCYNGKYYTYNGSMYLCKSDMLPCTWTPGTSGLWQWENVS